MRKRLLLVLALLVSLLGYAQVPQFSSAEFDGWIYNNPTIPLDGDNILNNRIALYVVSNGTVAAQTKKLDRSGIGRRMDGIFLSEQIGAEKPNPAFFERVFEAIRPDSPEEVMIVGDSLTSDMLGGICAGIVTCWYNPDGKPVPKDFHINYVIQNLNELPALLNI